MDMLARKVLPIVLGVVVLATGSSRAADRTTDAMIRKATGQYADLEFELAIKTLTRAYQNPGNTRSQLVKIYHLWGLCLGSLKKYDQALAAFRRALTLDPGFRVGDNVSPRVRKPFDQLARKNPRGLDVQVEKPENGRSGQPLELAVDVVADPADMIKSVRLWFRRGDRTYQSVRAPLRGEGRHVIRVPALTWEGGRGWKGPVFWYAVVEGEFQSRLVELGKPGDPLSFGVIEAAGQPQDDETAWYQQWWVWAIAGGVVAGTVTTAVLLYGGDDPSGPVRFSIEFPDR